MVDLQLQRQLESLGSLLGITLLPEKDAGIVDTPPFKLGWQTEVCVFSPVLAGVSLSSGLRASFSDAMAALSRSGAYWIPSRTKGILQKTYFADQTLWCSGFVLLSEPVQQWFDLLKQQRRGLLSLLGASI